LVPEEDPSKGAKSALISKTSREEGGAFLENKMKGWAGPRKGRAFPQSKAAEPQPRAVPGGGAATLSTLQVFRPQAGAPGDSAKHVGAKLLAIVEGEYEVWPALAGKRAVGT